MPYGIINEKYNLEVVCEYVFVHLGNLDGFYGIEYDIELCL